MAKQKRSNITPAAELATAPEEAAAPNTTTEAPCVVNARALIADMHALAEDLGSELTPEQNEMIRDLRGKAMALRNDKSAFDLSDGGLGTMDDMAKAAMQLIRTLTSTVETPIAGGGTVSVPALAHQPTRWALPKIAEAAEQQLNAFVHTRDAREASRARMLEGQIGCLERSLQDPDFRAMYDAFRHMSLRAKAFRAASEQISSRRCNRSFGDLAGEIPHLTEALPNARAREAVVDGLDIDRLPMLETARRETVITMRKFARYLENVPEFAGYGGTMLNLMLPEFEDVSDEYEKRRLAGVSASDSPAIVDDDDDSPAVA